jgi:hypothetical protein
MTITVILSFVLLMLVELLTNHCSTFCSFVDVVGTVDDHCYTFICYVDVGGTVDDHS